MLDFIHTKCFIGAQSGAVSVASDNTMIGQDLDSRVLSRSRWMCRLIHLQSDQALLHEYERRHARNAVWPEVVEDLRQRGIDRMEIWRLGSTAVMVMEVADDFPRISEKSLQPAVERWEAEMTQFQNGIDGAASDEKWRLMKCVFSLAEQTGL